MDIQRDIPQISLDVFSRQFSQRSKLLMWFLGAGASASAGVPTANEMVWEFKRMLFVSQQRASLNSVGDLGLPAVRARLQEYIDSLDNAPVNGANDEYAALFEIVFPEESDRHLFLRNKVSSAKSSYGHLALATLMFAGHTRIVWTTNFDSMVEDASAKVYGTVGSLTVATLDAPDLAEQAIWEEQWPLLVKLHGDFHSRRLKNTPRELRKQDELLRKTFIKSCQRYGLVMAGYSGRDSSVMSALEESLQKDSFPAGLFWLQHGEDIPEPRVVQLLNFARKLGIETGLVRIENFDEALLDLIGFFNDLDVQILETFALERSIRTGAWLYPKSDGPGWPVIRMNALPVVQVPTECRGVVCEIGGTGEVRRAIERSGANVIAARSKAQVLAFGGNSEISRAFEPFGITKDTIHLFDSRRQLFESSERGLLRQGLTRALARKFNMELTQFRKSDSLVPVNPREETWKPLQSQVKVLAGSLQEHPELQWKEGISIRMDWGANQLWLQLEPRPIFGDYDFRKKHLVDEFLREKSARRYNKQLNDLVHFWANLLAAEEEELCAFGIDDGFDAVYKLSPTTGFSRRARG